MSLQIWEEHKPNHDRFLEHLDRLEVERKGILRPTPGTQPLLNVLYGT